MTIYDKVADFIRCNVNLFIKFLQSNIKMDTIPLGTRWRDEHNNFISVACKIFVIEQKA